MIDEQPKSQSLRRRELTVDSDWLTTLGAILALLAGVLVLIRGIYQVMWRRFAEPVPMHWSFFKIFAEVFAVIACGYFFIFAYSLPKLSQKIAAVLMGMNLATNILVKLLPVSQSLRRAAMVSASLMFQVALAILLVALAKWLGSIVRLSPADEHRGGDH